MFDALCELLWFNRFAVRETFGLSPPGRFRFGDWAGLRYALLLADTFALCLGATLAASEGEHRRSLGHRGKMQRAKAR